ncbi:hypothetical protein [Geothrix sp. 21YS21S-2]|uniref:hypothetical protein n=1 Tax=Geothrix sp. 21YS21S-2 TaxID=3068893 RepID=UPI0027B9E795|nr:hypothetical protein [Geothrix sp. 21YS21S-2]
MGWVKECERRMRHFLKARGYRSARSVRNMVEAMWITSEQQLALQGNTAARMVVALPVDANIQDAEFRCFSQWGEDGILQFLVAKTGVRERTFVEFGVEDYQQSNTRFLMQNDGWSGLVIDGSPRNVERIRASPLFPRHTLNPVAAWISRENINDLIRGGGLEGPIGLLSVDIDGNDYWVWEAIDVVAPVIVVCEYNNLFGAHRAVTVPYDAGRVWDGSHAYWGASLRALCLLAESKGYAFVGSNKAGLNAFFVRKDHLGGLRVGDPVADFRPSTYREGRDPRNPSRFLDRRERLEAIADLELVDVERGERGKVRDLLTAEFG